MDRGADPPSPRHKRINTLTQTNPGCCAARAWARGSCGRGARRLSSSPSTSSSSPRCVCVCVFFYFPTYGLWCTHRTTLPSKTRVNLSSPSAPTSPCYVVPPGAGLAPRRLQHRRLQHHPPPAPPLPRRLAPRRPRRALARRLRLHGPGGPPRHGAPPRPPPRRPPVRLSASTIAVTFSFEWFDRLVHFIILSRPGQHHGIPSSQPSTQPLTKTTHRGVLPQPGEWGGGGGNDDLPMGLQEAPLDPAAAANRTVRCSCAAALLRCGVLLAVVNGRTNEITEERTDEGLISPLCPNLNPNQTNPSHPFHSPIPSPPTHPQLAEHLRRVLLCALIHVPLLVLLVRLPLRFGHRLVGRLLGLGPLAPLRLRFFPSPAAPTPGEQVGSSTVHSRKRGRMYLI